MVPRDGEIKRENGETMMTKTKKPLFGLTPVGDSDTSVMFTGTLANCRRMAFAHEMEVDKLEGAILSSDCGHAIYAPVNESAPMWTMFKNGGFIHKGRDNYFLLIPLSIWKKF